MLVCFRIFAVWCRVGQAVASGGGGRCGKLFRNELFHLLFSNFDAIRQLGGLGGGGTAGVQGRVVGSSNGKYLGLLKVMDFVQLSFEQIGEFLFICGIPIMRGCASLERTA